MQNLSYETQDGQKRTVTEIVADNVQFLGSSSGRDAMDEGAGAGGDDVGFSADFAPTDDDDAVPF